MTTDARYPQDAREQYARLHEQDNGLTLSDYVRAWLLVFSASTLGTLAAGWVAFILDVI